MVWNYSLETIQDNIALFEKANPNIKVNVKDYTWPTYHDTMVLRLKGKTRTDVFYNGEDWLPEFAAAGGSPRWRTSSPRSGSTRRRPRRMP